MTGPFDTTPFRNFQVSPISLILKKNSNKFRTIFYLSYPKSGSTGISCSISKKDYSLQYVKIDDAIEGIQRFGKGCFLEKTDIESAFRLVFVHPDEYELLGMYWRRIIITIRFSLFGYGVPQPSSINFRIHSNGFC